MSLTVTDLSIKIGGRTVVDHLSFRVADGARFGIIGESGSGKSLTALAVLGLLPDAATATGSILLTIDGGEEIELLGRDDRELAHIRGSEIGMVFQEPRTALNPLRRVGRQIGEPLRIHDRLSKREADQRAIELARDVLLPEPERLLKRYPHELSGGQRQRVAIAMAIARSPSLIIADEPTTALDVTIQAEILELFDELVTTTGASLIFVTHDLAVLAEVATDVVVLSHGAAVESGPVADIVRAPQHPVTQGLLAAARATSWTPGGVA
ncbi:ABC transporter ATP-binding protein [Lacisediminihabitans changchengi]|uniref:ABC transporter ATP-binding protein n=1 Tax=Lacisediminihabitans changchengi TaxID=2787634 RepID=A0A934SLA3_9MICO|nr:ABC transporter ATP-binding protein [Lacisediminihabitans changchengi]MBK4347454.1 ABC transporter ATP-binding protein [Lacisediminihabitans changchengi]